MDGIHTATVAGKDVVALELAHPDGLRQESPGSAISVNATVLDKLTKIHTAGQVGRGKMGNGCLPVKIGITDGIMSSGGPPLLLMPNCKVEAKKDCAPSIFCHGNISIFSFNILMCWHLLTY